MINVVEKQIQDSTIPIPQLSEQQEQEIKAYWDRYGIDMPTQWHRLITAKTGIFRPEYVAEPVFHYDIKSKMNNTQFGGVWSDKSYTDYFLRGVRTATCVIRNVNGRFLDHEFKMVSLDEAEKIIQQYPHLVVKPTAFTDTGKGVELIHAPFDLKRIHDQYRKNYVLQIPLKQHADMAKLNASSINTLRVNSVLFDNESRVMSAFVKVGQAGEFAANHGSNRFFIGVRMDGSFVDYAIDHDLNKYDKIPSGFAFAKEKVPNFDRVCEIVELAHKCSPHFGFAFWDVCICDDGEPAIVEVNLRYPDATIPQVAQGPFLGEYTERIMEYISERQ